MEEKIQNLIKKSKEVIESCCLENGAIIAADSGHFAYPKEVQNYSYVWPRDASFILAAADILNLKNVHERFYSWLWKRAEDVSESGLIFQNYYVNGPKRWLAFQPDQNGSVLWSLYNHYKSELDNALKYKELVEKLANGICNNWNGNNFKILTQNLWEQDFTFPRDETNHTYSLAACCHGLRCANKIINNQRWLKVSDEMKQQIDDSYKSPHNISGDDVNQGYFLRLNGKLKDITVDSSMLGLIYPFKVYGPEDQKILNTINHIENKIVKNNCVYRYEKDLYDSYRYSGVDARRGSGFWPILNFWISIYYSLKNKRKKALDYFLTVVDNAEDYIPEQIFFNKIQISPKPLAWSHAMFVICSKYLGFLK